jgi:very-short-patch-repair endonuclease
VDPSAEEAIIAVASRQCGLATWAQLQKAGFTPEVVRHRVRTRRFERLHRGVYRIVPIAVENMREMAAVLACGAGSIVSHCSSAALLGLRGHAGDAAPVDVTVIGRDAGCRPGIRAHRVFRLETEDRTIVRGIPVTSAARTIFDLAAVLAQRELEQVVAQAERLGLTERGVLMSLLDRRGGRRGIRTLRALLDHADAPAFTRSIAEERFLGLIRRAQLPRPKVNARVADFEVDFLWLASRLVVEIDGFAFHSSQRSFENDRLRDAQLAARGLRVIRVTWRQLDAEPMAAVSRIAQALAVAGPPTG